MHRLLPILEAGITRYGGSIDHRLDDSLFAFFGARSTAHEV